MNIYNNYIPTQDCETFLTLKFWVEGLLLVFFWLFCSGIQKYSKTFFLIWLWCLQGHSVILRDKDDDDNEEEEESKVEGQHFESGRGAKKLYLSKQCQFGIEMLYTSFFWVEGL